MKIPDDVFATRCKYCHHGRPGKENVEIPDGAVHCYPWKKEAPCDIEGICHFDDVPGECLSFTPNPMFGICEYCEYNNSFHEGYCTIPGGPVNKRRVFLGWSAGKENDYWGEHALFTCDRYRVSANWKDIIMRNALCGRAPENFDPETWEPLKKIEGTAAAEQWAKLQAEARANEEAKAKTLEKQKAISGPDETEQISLFEMEWQDSAKGKGGAT